MFDSSDEGVVIWRQRYKKKYDCAIVFTRKCQKSFVRGYRFTDI